ncbi:MAG: prepilin peptidase [Bacilli bacterium]|nr:prepilin peptidase [Bacilli bacterium]
MKFLYIIIFFILGTCMGSFYTVVGLRLPKKEKFLTGRSHCDACGHDLSLLDMVPVLSFLFLRGKCHYCKEKIDSLSTYMEIFTGILYALAYYAFGFSGSFVIALGIISMLVILSVSDIKYYTIPDEIIIFFAGYFTIANTMIEGIIPALLHIGSGLILFAFMYGIMLLGNLIFKKETLGGGDIKLMFDIGLVLNPFLGIVVIFIASFLALPISFLILWKQKQNLVPFGPFLLTGFLFLYFTKIDMQMIIDFIKSF